jgi:hypothetical protein
MMRLACLFGLVALAAMGLLLVRLDGATATVFSFVGFPALGIALALYVFGRWRAGAFRLNAPSAE